MATLAMTVALLGACASDHERSVCETVCSKMHECCSELGGCAEYGQFDECVPACQAELDDAARILQKPQSEAFVSCLDGYAAWVDAASCREVGEVESTKGQGGPPDCFAEAVRDPECRDPGRLEYAESVCLRDECSETQRADCMTRLMSILEDDVPCLNTRALPEAVTCEFECTSSTTVGAVSIDQEVSHWSCSYPG